MRASDGGIAVCPLGSGSKGNAYWVETSKTAILVDAGFSYKQLAGRVRDIGRDIDDVRHIFITHEHNDHIQALRVLLKRHQPTVWASGGTLRAIKQLFPEKASVKRLNGNLESADEISVQAVRVQHDAAEPMAFRFDAPNGSLAIVTDLGQWSAEVTDALDGPDLLVCEANHDPDMLEMGPYPWYLKQRIASDLGHLSNQRGAELAADAVKRGTREVVLGHLSETNNDVSVALDVFNSMLNGDRERVRLNAASQVTPGPWIRSTDTVGTTSTQRSPSIASLLRRPR